MLGVFSQAFGQVWAQSVIGGWRLHLRTTKTNTKVSIPAPDRLVNDIQRLPGEYLFWAGNSTPDACSGYWRKLYERAFTLAGIKGNPHRFRHTFGKNLPANEVPLESVSILLGHRKLAVAEKHYAQFVPEHQSVIDSQIRRVWASQQHHKK